MTASETMTMITIFVTAGISCVFAYIAPYIPLLNLNITLPLRLYFFATIQVFTCLIETGELLHKEISRGRTKWSVGVMNSTAQLRLQTTN